MKLDAKTVFVCTLCGAMFVGTVTPHECLGTGSKTAQVVCPLPPKHHAHGPERDPAPMRTVPIAAAVTSTLTTASLDVRLVAGLAPPSQPKS